MFNKELFLSLCEKYGVELSDTVTEPMLRQDSKLYPITPEDIRTIFSFYQNHFEYSSSGIEARVEPAIYQLLERVAIAC